MGLFFRSCSLFQFFEFNFLNQRTLSRIFFQPVDLHKCKTDSSAFETFLGSFSSRTDKCFHSQQYGYERGQRNRFREYPNEENGRQDSYQSKNKFRNPNNLSSLEKYIQEKYNNSESSFIDPSDFVCDPSTTSEKSSNTFSELGISDR